MRAYIATYIYIGLHPEASIGDYWNTDETKGSIHRLVSKHIGKTRWYGIGDERYNKHVEALVGHVRHTAIPDHGKQVKMQGKKHCVACVCAGRKVKSSTAIKPLQELSVNSMQGGEKRRQRPPFSMYGCALCGINLCKNSASWIEQ